MKKFEYLVVQLNLSNRGPAISTQLNSYGAEGWELVACFSGSRHAIFMREVLPVGESVG